MRVNGFYGHIAQKHARSIGMFLGFAIACQIAFGVLLTVPIIFSGKTNFIFVEPINYLMAWGPQVLLLSLILFGIRYQLHRIFLRHATGYRDATHMTHPRLYRIVQNLAGTAGLRKVPELGIMPSGALNAFACGMSQNSAMIMVTEGLLSALDDDELAAVMAHEIAHIVNGDMAMMAVANASLGTVEFAEKLNPFKLGGKRTVLFIFILPLLFLAAIFSVAMSLASTISKISRLMIGSSREFIADAEAVRLTHNPAALISALRKIEGRSDVQGVDPMTSAMMIDGPTEGALASHPTIEQRVEILRQLSGGMIYGTARRKDTRANAQPAFATAAFIPVQPAPVFGRANALSAPRPKVDLRNNIIDRVNVGNDKNVFGLSKGQGQVVLIGLIALAGAKFMMVNSLTKSLESLSPSLVAAPEQTLAAQTNLRFETISSDIKTPRPVPSLKPKTSQPPALRKRKAD